MFRMLIYRRTSSDEQRHLAARFARRLPHLHGIGLYSQLSERAVSRVVRKVSRTLSSHPSLRLQPGFFQRARPNQPEAPASCQMQVEDEMGSCSVMPYTMSPAMISSLQVVNWLMLFVPGSSTLEYRGSN